jgi:archaellum component FlaC
LVCILSLPLLNVEGDSVLFLELMDQTQEENSSSRANENTHDDELDAIRDVDTFVADQERFLQ